MILGLSGRMGAGKDTVCERLRYLLAPTEVERRSFADPLKDSVCALFGITRDELGAWKRDTRMGVCIAGLDADTTLVWFTWREFLQRYGTEAHRGVFGDDFWLDATLPDGDYRPQDLIVLTDCRFPNEARRVKDLGGVVYEVVGPEGPMDPNAKHASERPLSKLDGYIFNKIRDDRYHYLDLELKKIVIPDLLGRG